MFHFVLCKIRNKKWMILSLLLGNLLMIAIAASTSMYSNAALQRMLTNDLSEYLVEHNKYPGTVIVSYDCRGFGELKESEYVKVDLGPELLKNWMKEMDINILRMGIHYEKTGVIANHEHMVEDAKNSLRLRLTGYSDLGNYVHMLSGEMYTDQLEDNTFDVIVNENTFVTQKLMLGEKLQLSALKDAAGNPYYARVAGVFECNDVQDVYWTTNPTAWDNICMMDENLFRQLFINLNQTNVNYDSEWYAVVDYTDMQGERVKEYQEITERYLKQYEALKVRDVKTHYGDIFENYVIQARKLNTTIWVLQFPVFILLVSFVFMVAGQMMDMEENEIAVYKSRGANKRQIVGVYLLQSLVIGAVALGAGIPLGVWICKVLGASNSFLEFVQRKALPVQITGQSLGIAVLTAVVSVCAMVLPVLRYAKVNIVDHKRKKHGRREKPLWKRLGLDFVLVGSSVYGLIQFDKQKEYLAQQVLDGASLNPFLYICSSLFMVGAALIILRIFPWIVKGVFYPGKKWWSPAMYSSFLRIIRTGKNQGFLIIFLILTIAMGVFSAQAARTINANAQERIQYTVGADLVLKEYWPDNSQIVNAGEEIVYKEPSFEKYRELEGVESVTRVYVDDKVQAFIDGGKISNIMLMGVHTREFGETAYFKENLLPEHYHTYLNAISQNAKAVLVSSNFRDKYGYEIGDIITYNSQGKHNMQGIIEGFVEYWPAYEPVVRVKEEDGSYSEREHFLIVAHLTQIQSVWGVMPYQIWIKTKGASAFMYEYVQEQDLKLSMFQDTAAQLIALKNDPVFQGTNGILTLGFICILVLCIMGFLIYWILSIQSRTLQFGIFRAMGMSMRGIFVMLINEQIFITGISMGAGLLLGILTAKLFVPLIQIAYSTADQVIPIEIVSEGSDYIRLFAVMGAGILLCMVILGWLISKIKITQALKLGED